MSDLIRREDAIAEVSKEFKNSIIGTHCAVNAIYRVPSAQPESSEVARDIATIIENEMDMRVIAQTERKKGKWIEKHHAYSDEEGVIEEWQSCQCSECGRYDTRPYMYYFQEPHFCSWCGAEMRGEEDE